jgi:hypothetical protein
MGQSVLLQIGYESAVRALDLQERAIEQLRARTGTLLAATSLTASFLGAQAINRTNGLETFGVLALLSLVISTVGCIYVLLPKSGFVFGLNAPVMYETLFEFAEDDDEVRRRLVYWLELFWSDNQSKIDSLGRFYAGAAIASMFQLLLWCVALTATIS